MKKLFVLVPLILLFVSPSLWANKTSVEVKAPAQVKKGSEITIVVTATHKGNSKAHFTDWVTIKQDGKEIKKWEYNKNALPSSAIFTVEYKITVTADCTIEAQGHCNLHGSAGPKSVVIKTTEN
jgi:desulfoferrodoxin (superoxide reductase-like protein)